MSYYFYYGTVAEFTNTHTLFKFNHFVNLFVSDFKLRFNYPVWLISDIYESSVMANAVYVIINNHTGG